MKILHTADWHLGKRLGRIDRSDDLKRAVGRVVEVCRREEVDVLLIAGDLFDNVHRADDIRAAVELLCEGVRPFLRDDGTILAVAGNHDGEAFSATLQHAMSLADPSDLGPGTLLSRGRFYLATRPAFYQLKDRDGLQVQFVLMPYPLASRYLDDALTPVEGGLAGKNRRLRAEYADVIRRIRQHNAFDARLHSVLVTHLFLQGATLPGGLEVTADGEEGAVICPPEDLGAGWAYVALGDIHKPQILGGRPHVRYSGPIERLGMDERENEVGVVLAEIGINGLGGEPAWVSLEATPFLDVVIDDPSEALSGLETANPDAARALVRCRVRYTPGVDDLDEIHRLINEAFPRCYRVELIEARGVAPRPEQRPGLNRRDFRKTVMDYLRTRLNPETDPNAEAVFGAAESLIEEARR